MKYAILAFATLTAGSAQAHPGHLAEAAGQPAEEDMPKEDLQEA